MKATTTSLESSAREALVDRILASRGFQRAARLRELLVYITTHADNPEALSEQQIGINVFGRPESYSPGDDNIVRATARQLRTKLKEYFESDGAEEPLVLDIPKGGYQPVFVERPSATGNPEPPPSRHQFLWIALTALFAISTLWLAVEHSRPAESVSEPESVFAQFLKQAQGSVRFVLTDSAFSSMNGWIDNQVDVRKYSSREYIQQGERLYAGNEAMLRAWKDMSKRQITSLADVGVLTKLLQAYPSSARRIEIRHARHMRTRDFKMGNIIVTGSPLSNPWSALFDSGLNFQFDSRRIVNRRSSPGPAGEADEYRSGSEHWSRIALVRNLSGNGWVLLIAGLSFEGTEGAGEFLLRPESLTDVRRVLGVGPEDALPPFELVLSSKAMEGTAYSSRIVAWRRH